jgi:hypothetical protein
MTLPVNQCLLTNPHNPHDWWYTSSGGGHMLAESSVGDPLERNQKQHHCQGIPTYEWGVIVTKYPEILHRGPWPEDEARTWVKEAEEDFREGYFSLVRRPVGNWEEVDD